MAFVLERALLTWSSSAADVVTVLQVKPVAKVIEAQETRYALREPETDA